VETLDAAATASHLFSCSSPLLTHLGFPKPSRLSFKWRTTAPPELDAAGPPATLAHRYPLPRGGTRTLSFSLTSPVLWRRRREMGQGGGQPRRSDQGGFFVYLEPDL
jgi:hypothetical protein